MIGDKEAIPFLTFPAASPEAPPAVRAAAQAAIAHLTGQPFFAQPHKPVQVLTDAAWRYHRHQIEFTDDLALSGRGTTIARHQLRGRCRAPRLRGFSACDWCNRHCG